MRFHSKLIAHHKTVLVGLFILALLTFGSIWVRESLLSSLNWVRHTHEVQQNLTKLMSVLQDAETGQRGYLLTGSDRYLAPYKSAKSDLGLVFSKLRSLTADNPRQRAFLNLTENRISDKFGELDSTIMLYKSGRADEALVLVKGNYGKEVMDQIRGFVGEMEKEESRLLRIREQDAKDGSRLMMWLQLITVFVIVMIAFKTFKNGRLPGGNPQ